ncbi:MAG: Asp-tRNA(Asn)/Glu-tRNA(Gln) amidotransferase subunit GatA [Planctomycetota bacterium]
MNPSPFDLIDAGVVDLSLGLHRGTWTAVQILEAHLEQIRKHDAKYGAFLSIVDGVHDRAREIDRKRQDGRPLGPLAGVPIAIKDNICIKGQPTSCGSAFLQNFRPPYSAEVIERLEAADALLIGRTNMDEFGMGSSTENSSFGITRNPWSPSRTPGGSSGGSAAAVAARMCAAALGSDTGGSIRQPAAFCGITGLKPSYGRVSRRGLIAYASSLEQIGPLTRSAADAAAILAVISGHDQGDSSSSTRPAFGLDELSPLDLKGLRLGLPREFFGEGINPAIEAQIMSACQRLRDAGAELVDVNLPHTPYAIPAYYVIATSEASSNLARYDGIGYGRRAEAAQTLDEVYAQSRSLGFGPEVKRRLMLGTFCLSSDSYADYYDKALRVRTLLRNDFATAFDECDLILGPTAPILPFKLGSLRNDPLAMYLSDVLTVSLNLAGLPGASVPAGFAVENEQRLPIGLQIIAKPFEEALILRLATAWEMIGGFHRESPRL